MSRNGIQTIHNGGVIPLGELQPLPVEEFLQRLVDLTGQGWRIASYFGSGDRHEVCLYAVLAGSQGRIGLLRSGPLAGILPSIVSVCPEAHLFEREIGEQWGVTLDGHPWPRPVRYHLPYHGRQDAWGRERDAALLPCVGDFYRVAGEEIHEVAVGPVHAGIIEPGHFRFQCHGELVFHLEIALGYQHRGIERAILGGPHCSTVAQMETVAGDTTIGHGIAHAMVREALAGAESPPAADRVRAVALELERLANHCGDLGALAGDVGYLPAMSFCGRIRGDFLNLTAALCGSRFGRGVVRPGGVLCGSPDEMATELADRLQQVRRDYQGAVELLWSTSSVMARFEKTGQVSPEDARDLGLVGPAARACGLCRDVRRDHPFGLYRHGEFIPQTGTGGDVFSRAMVRWRESEASMDMVGACLEAADGGKLMVPCGAPRPGLLAVALVEGWRGEICHVALSDAAGRFSRYKITDPSFHNWSGLAMALRNEQISDFPLCNKSFNLSYCGFDL